MVQVPVVRMDTTPPDTLQTDAVALPNATLSPDVVEAVSA
jgi:hypothetical protein